MTKKKQKAKSPITWGKYLSIRSKLIDEFHEEGRTDASIAATLSMDPMQVFLIRTRDRTHDGLLMEDRARR